MTASVIAGAFLVITGDLATTKAVESRNFVVNGAGVNITTVDTDLNWWIVIPLLTFFAVGLAFAIAARKTKAKS